MNDEIRTVLARSRGLRICERVEIGCRYLELSNDKACRLYRGMLGDESYLSAPCKCRNDRDIVKSVCRNVKKGNMK